MIEVIKSGGLLMIPILLCGVAATFIVIERLIFFASVRKGERGLFGKVSALVRRREFDEAVALCDESGTPLGRLAKKAILFRNYPENDIKEAVLNESSREVPRLERFLPSLGTIANISTLLGLLGTVTGNIQAFGVLGSTGTMGNPAVLAGAIAEALVTTAAGLFISIPAIVFYNYFVAVVNRTITGMETSVSDLVLLLSGRDNLRPHDGGSRILVSGETSV